MNNRKILLASYSLGKQHNNRIAALCLLFAATVMLVKAVPAYAPYFFFAAGVVATVILLLIIFDRQLSGQWQLGILLSLLTVPLVAYLLVRLFNFS